MSSYRWPPVPTSGLKSRDYANERSSSISNQSIRNSTELYQLAQSNIIPLPNEPDFATCDDTLTRFLVATNYVVEDAFKQLKTAVEWRREYQPLTIQCLTVACCNPKIGKKFVQTFADCYPETLYKFILINHGTFFHGIWKAIKVFIDPNTVKKVKLIRKEKIQRTFNEMFTPDTITWLLDEIKLKKINITENQLRFWESPHSYELHDPRGTHEYIQRCIEPLKLFIEQQQQQQRQQPQQQQQQQRPQRPQQRQQPQQQSKQKSFILTYDNLGLKTHMPHTNIMDCLNKTLKQVKIQSFYNGKYIKPNKEELQAYGVDINDNLSEISGGSEEEE
ncbi:unnamed protein product [Schistosoma mattheei]|uniref:CRAL-TRIO domain-containing protein n=1 Tax=Schistosoma mattheei TaxID=31246 RepID=A0AA85C1V4_9TREM|nr:unnamed protein product [Schistosoma mattheei]